MTTAAIAILGITLLLLQPATDSVAAASASKQDLAPLRIHAQAISLDQQRGTMVYRGRVRVQQGDLSVQADRLVAVSRAGRIDQFTAYGKPLVVIHAASPEHQALRIQAHRLHYQVGAQRLRLQQNVSVLQQQDQLQCSELVYDARERRAHAKGSAEQAVFARLTTRPQAPKLKSQP